MTKIYEEIPTVDFVYLKNVGLSRCLLEFSRSASSRPPARRSTQDRSTDHAGHLSLPGTRPASFHKQPIYLHWYEYFTLTGKKYLI